MAINQQYCCKTMEKYIYSKKYQSRVKADTSKNHAILKKPDDTATCAQEKKQTQKL